MKKCLMTGGTGLIGTNLRAALLPDWQVFAVSRSAGGDVQSQSHMIPVAADLAGQWDTASFPAQIDAVIHLAQSEHFRDFPEKAVDIFQVNAVSTLRLLDYARQAGARTFVLASSGGVYGHHE